MQGGWESAREGGGVGGGTHTKLFYGDVWAVYVVLLGNIIKVT